MFQFIMCFPVRYDVPVSETIFPNVPVQNSGMLPSMQSRPPLACSVVLNVALGEGLPHATCVHVAFTWQTAWRQVSFECLAASDGHDAMLLMTAAQFDDFIVL